MAKFRKIPTSETQHQWQFMCPGCGYSHAITEEVHTFNHDVDKPTLSPSVLYNHPGNETWPRRVCHSFIKDGMIEFLSDCTHSLAGKTVELPEFEDKNDMFK